MSQRPAWRVGLRQAAVAVLIAPSVVGALALFIADPEIGLLVGGPALGLAITLWSIRGGWAIAAGVLGFAIAGFGALLSFGILLGWADSGGSSESRPSDAFGLAVLSFLIAMPAAIVLAIIQASRPDDRRGTPVAAADDRDRPAAGGRPGGLAIVGISTVLLTIGAYVGYTSAYPWNAPSGLAELGRYLISVPVLALFLALGIAAVIAIAAWANGGLRGPRGSRIAGGAALLGLLGVGSFGGFVLTPVLELPYSDPIVAFGSATARFDRLPTFVPYVDGYVECESEAGPAVSSVWTEYLGQLGSRLLHARISLDAGGSAEVRLSGGWKYLLDVARDSQAEVLETSDRGASGRVKFRAPVPSDVEGEWPAELSGELTWMCGNWLGRAASPTGAERRAGGRATSEAVGRLDLRLAGVDWVPPPSGATATCDFETGGSVGNLYGDPYGMGLLQGTSGAGSLVVYVDLRAEHAPGSEVLALISLVGTGAPFDQQEPVWAARVRLIEVADGERTGRGAFSDMPTVVDPRDFPMSAGWPDTLTGEFTWMCG